MKYLPVLLLVAFTGSNALGQTSAATQPDYRYAGNLKIDAQTGFISANWVITVQDSSETAITFLLRDTLGDIDVSGPGVAETRVERQSGLGDFWALNVTLAEPGEHRIIRVSYSGVLLPEPMENRINAIEPDRVELNVDSFWFPIDGRFSRVLTADLAVHIGTGWQGVTTGDALPIDDGVRILNTDPRMDIAFALSRSFHITQADGFTIYDQREQDAGTGRLLTAAGNCRTFLNTRFGSENPLPAGRLLITERPSSGYSRENYIALTDIAETQPGPLTRFVCHEFSHYWSQGAKFDTVDNWLNEAFAEYVGLMAVREYLGPAAYENMLASFNGQIAGKNLPPVWTAGATERGPESVQYRKAPLLLAQLESEMGQQAFLAFVSEYFRSTEKTPR